MLSPRVAFLDHQRLVLNVDNSVLKQRIAALSQDKVFKDGNNIKSCALFLSLVSRCMPENLTLGDQRLLHSSFSLEM